MIKIEEIRKKFEEFNDIAVQIKKMSMDGIKEILNNYNDGKEYSLTENNINIALYSDDDDDVIMARSISLYEDGTICIDGDNNCSYQDHLIDTNTMYYIFESMYLRIVENSDEEIF